MKKFEDFVKQGIVKIRSPNKSIARDLFEESERKYTALKKMLEKIELSDKNANDVIEGCYDILIYLIRAKLYLNGFRSSGASAHESEVSYMIELGFSENEARIMDELRYFRNGIKYYGKRFDEVYAKKILDFLERNYRKLKNLVAL